MHSTYQITGNRQVDHMTKRITPGEIKKANRQQIFQFIYENQKVAQQDIAYALHLSRPTVASNVTELEDEGLIFKNGQQDSDQIGRKAAAYSVVSNYRVAVGVELMNDQFTVIVVDLYGNKIDRIVHKIRFEKKETYYRTVCEQILHFLEKLNLKDEQILGIGFAIQGLISADGKTVVYGAILDCTDLSTGVFQKYLHFPCVFVHDPDGAAMSELWRSPDLKDAIYLSLSRHLGGSIISDRQVQPGKHGHSGTFEHKQIKLDGKPCYCGKKGCAETVCSMGALLGDEDPDEFFEKVRNMEEDAYNRWYAYLSSLARMICNLHLILDVDFILGGHLAPYFTEKDIQYLYNEVRKHTPFYDVDDYIKISKMPSHNIAIGAALPYITQFLNNIEG